jgi:hypothetical protein
LRLPLLLLLLLLLLLPMHVRARMTVRAQMRVVHLRLVHVQGGR